MAENDYFSNINLQSYGTASSPSSTGENAPQQYFLFNNPNLSDKDKKYLNQLAQDRTKSIKSLQEDINMAQTASTQEEKEMAAKTIELQQKCIGCTETEMDSVNYKNTPNRTALKDAITNCKDPAKLNQLLQLRAQYAQHLIDIQKTLASADTSKLSAQNIKDEYALIDFYKNNIG